MMSGKRGSNASLNLLEEKVIGNLMDCSKASIEFKGHRRAHSSGSQGMGLLQISKIDTYPPKLGTGGSTAANYSSPSTPPKPTSSQLSIDGYPQPPALIVDSPPSHGISPRLSPSPQLHHTPATRPHLPLSQSVSTSVIPDNYATPPIGRRSSEDAAATARPSESRRPFAPLKPLGLQGGDKGPCPSPSDKRSAFKLPFKMPAAQPVVTKSVKQEEKLQEIVGKMSGLCINGTEIASKEKIGHGVSGHVYKLKDVSGKWMAAKCMLWTDSAGERERVIRDLDVMVKHRSPHIVQYYGSQIIQKEVWVFMELMDTCLGKLLKKMKPDPFPEEVIGKIVVAVVKALHYLKTEFAVIHRDVKPSNILMDRAGRVKLCDFGISGRLVDSKAHTRDAGCVGYMAPERIKVTNIETGYDVRADVWSLGISLVELSTAEFPYSKFSGDFQVLASIVNDEPPVPKDTGLSSELVNFISLCLTKDYEKRPSFKNLLDTEFVRHYDQLSVDIAVWYRQVTSSKRIT